MSLRYIDGPEILFAILVGVLVGLLVYTMQVEDTTDCPTSPPVTAAP